jgi:hypothetical protein
MADDEPVAQHPHRAELLLDGRRRGLDGLQLLYIDGDVVRPDRRERQATLVAPSEELVAGIGAARVRVADIRGEELDIAPAGLVPEIGDDRRHDIWGREVDLGRLDGGWKLGVGRFHEVPLPSNVAHDKGEIRPRDGAMDRCCPKPATWQSGPALQVVPLPAVGSADRSALTISKN